MKNKGGRPRMTVDLEKVHQLRSRLFSFERIAGIIGISRDTILRRLKETPDRCSRCSGKYSYKGSLEVLQQEKNLENSSNSELGAFRDKEYLKGGHIEQI